MNNRKQQVLSFLDSITQKELDEYIQVKKINNDFLAKINKVKNTKTLTHFDRLSNNIGEDLGKCLDNYYKLGEAYVIAFVLECFYDDKYKIKDLKDYIKAMIKSDEQLKNYVYDLMKDF